MDGRMNGCADGRINELTDEQIHRAAPCARVLGPFRARRLGVKGGDLVRTARMGRFTNERVRE
jgi:hypothetical protein